MSNKIPQEEWFPLPFMEGEHSLSNIDEQQQEAPSEDLEWEVSLEKREV